MGYVTRLGKWEMEEKIILERKLTTLDGSLWIGLVFSRISTSGRLLRTSWRTSGLHKAPENSWVAEELFASKEGLCSTVLPIKHLKPLVDNWTYVLRHVRTKSINSLLSLNSIVIFPQKRKNSPFRNTHAICVRNLCCLFCSEIKPELTFLVKLEDSTLLLSKPPIGMAIFQFHPFKAHHTKINLNITTEYNFVPPNLAPYDRFFNSLTSLVGLPRQHDQCSTRFIIRLTFYDLYEPHTLNYVG